MLGHTLCSVLPERFETVATFRTPPPAGLACLARVRALAGVDALAFQTVERAFAESRPDAVVNAIGLVKQLPAAADPVASIALNALFPHRVAALCATSGARLVHLSTDCVFSGERGAYTEDDRPDALDLYGRSKLLGEVAGPQALTLRTSLIGRELGSPKGLVEWFLSHAGSEVHGYAQVIWSGLTTQAVATLIADLLSAGPALHGVWHVSSEAVSKYELLLRLNEVFRADVRVVRDDTVRWDRSLDSTRFWRATGYRRPDLDAMIRQLAAGSPPSDRQAVAAHAGSER